MFLEIDLVDLTLVIILMISVKILELQELN